MSEPSRGKFVAGFLLVFVAGLATGIFLGGLHNRHNQMQMAFPRPAGERVRARMEAALALTPEQVKKIAPVFDKTARELEAVRGETAKRVGEILATADRELAPDLTEAQRKKLAAMQKERADARNRHTAEVR